MWQGWSFSAEEELLGGSSQEIVYEIELKQHSLESLCLFSSFFFMFSPMAYLFTSAKIDPGNPSRNGVEAYGEEKPWGMLLKLGASLDSELRTPAFSF